MADGSKVFTAHYLSPVGLLTLAGTPDCLTGLWLPKQQYFGRTLPADAEPGEGEGIFPMARIWLDRYFAGERPDPAALPLAPGGTPCQQTVWEILREIPYGTVTTYAAVAREAARRMGRERMACRAAGGAIARNPISILIPCHRVVGTGGRLTGYAGGLAAKAFLLEREGALPLVPGNPFASGR